MQLHAGTTLYAAPCAAFILTDNISVSTGATDSCTGRITAFNLETLEVTSVRMDASCQEGLVSRSWVLCQCMRRLTGYNAQRYSRRMFPLMLGLQTHANWHHGARGQGATMATDVVLHATGASAPNLLHVMLSGVTQSKLLSVVSGLTPEHLHPM